MTEDEWHEYEHSRGPLAYKAETAECYECCGFDGVNFKTQKIVADAGVSQGSDPWQLYKLACGHIVF